MSRRLTPYDVIADLERLASERPDLPEQRRSELYEQACREGQANPQYGVYSLFVGVSATEQAVHAYGLKVPLFDVPELETILARIAELAPPVSARGGLTREAVIEAAVESWGPDESQPPTQPTVAETLSRRGYASSDRQLRNVQGPRGWQGILEDARARLARR